MHQHLPGVAVMLTDAKFKFTYPDGCTEEFHKKAGEFHMSEAPWGTPARKFVQESV